jgi:ribonuclease HII
MKRAPKLHRPDRQVQKDLTGLFAQMEACENKPVRSSPDFQRELALVQRGFSRIAGVDEAGRGAWAGPVVAAAVILPPTPEAMAQLAGVNDSKKLSAKQRDALRSVVQQVAVAWAVGSASCSEIDALGIVPATRLAMGRAVEGLRVKADALLIDAVKLPAVKLYQHAFNFADSISLSVAAASILAKTARDARMGELDAAIAGYQFALHKGYGTRLHQRCLRALGPSPAHRHSFKPIRAMISAAHEDHEEKAAKAAKRH